MPHLVVGVTYININMVTCTYDTRNLSFIAFSIPWTIKIVQKSNFMFLDTCREKDIYIYIYIYIFYHPKTCDLQNNANVTSHASEIWYIIYVVAALIGYLQDAIQKTAITTFSVRIRLLTADELLIPHAESLILQITVSFYFKN